MNDTQAGARLAALPAGWTVEYPNNDRSAFVLTAPDGRAKVATKGGFLFDLIASLAAQMASPVDEAHLLEFVQARRVALTPEFDGGWLAEVFDDGDHPSMCFTGSTPRLVLEAAESHARALLAAPAQESTR